MYNYILRQDQSMLNFVEKQIPNLKWLIEYEAYNNISIRFQQFKLDNQIQKLILNRNK